MHNFPRPSTPTVKADRTAVTGPCPLCGAENLSSYRVLSEGGWWNVTKCQSCLHSVKREKGPLLGPIVPLGDSL